MIDVKSMESSVKFGSEASPVCARTDCRSGSGGLFPTSITKPTTARDPSKFYQLCAHLLLV